MGKTGFLDQKIPAGGFVKIQDMGEASDRNKNHHDRRFDHVSGPRTKMYNHKRGISSVGKRSFLIMIKRDRKRRRTKRRQKEGTLQAMRTMQVMVEEGQFQNDSPSERGSCFMLDPQRFRCHKKKKWGIVDSSKVVGRKGQMSNRTDRYRAGIQNGHRDQQTRRLQLPRG